VSVVLYSFAGKGKRNGGVLGALGRARVGADVMSEHVSAYLTYLTYLLTPPSTCACPTPSSVAKFYLLLSGSTWYGGGLGKTYGWGLVDMVWRRFRFGGSAVQRINMGACVCVCVKCGRSERSEGRR
jgi:hypothetical protein